MKDFNLPLFKEVFKIFKVIVLKDLITNLEVGKMPNIGD